VIQAIVNGAWFRDTNAHGVKYACYFTSRLPLPALALVLTLVSCLCHLNHTLLTCFKIEVVLDEWQTGEEKRLVFSEVEYKSKYERHLKTLKKWEEEIPYRMEEICKDLLNNGR
jgi:hypothetical protein